jgi:hypothetical protein
LLRLPLLWLSLRLPLLWLFLRLRLRLLLLLLLSLNFRQGYRSAAYNITQETN